MKREQNNSENLIREECGLPSVVAMTYKRETTVVVARGYTYDNLGRPITRQTTRQGSTVNDTFTYNSRSELIGATVSGKVYGYSYDNIGNRKTAQEDAEEVTAYTANQLNQYTAIQQGSGEEGEANEADTFTPTYDADGNQTRIRTATGIWNVTYNAENRPIRFESADGSTVVECTYDYMGRRHTRKVTVNGAVNSYLRYIYRGYLQIAAIDAVSGVFRWFLVWDPTQPTATRPLAIRKDSTWYAYGWDLTKNITEIFGKAGYLRTAYTYAPYGTATADGDVTQPITWSSEYADEELALIYYNYRHYNPTDGRWISRDPIGEQGGVNLYGFIGNTPIASYDRLGLWMVQTTSASEDLGGKALAHIFNAAFAKDSFATLFFRWWAVGNIVKVTSNEDSISDYLSINPSLQNEIIKQLINLLSDGSEIVTKRLTGIELKENGHFTGYGLLHGVNENVGGFQMEGTHRTRREYDTCIHDFNIKYTWNDIMDPNERYVDDIAYANYVRIFTDSRDYDIHISWTRTTQIIEQNGNVISMTGYATSSIDQVKKIGSLPNRKSRYKR